jgi:LysR family transcriptional activator of nhaA
MMKIAGVSGLGLLAIPAIIEDDVRRIYRLQRIGLPIGVIEQFYAVSVERKIKHPGVLAIRQHAEKASAVSP